MQIDVHFFHQPCNVTSLVIGVNDGGRALHTTKLTGRLPARPSHMRAGERARAQAQAGRSGTPVRTCGQTDPHGFRGEIDSLILAFHHQRRRRNEGRFPLSETAAGSECHRDDHCSPSLACPRVPRSKFRSRGARVELKNSSNSMKQRTGESEHCRQSL